MSGKPAKSGACSANKARRSRFQLKAVEIDINIDKALTAFAKILSSQEKTLLGGGA